MTYDFKIIFKYRRKNIANYYQISPYIAKWKPSFNALCPKMVRHTLKVLQHMLQYF